MMRYLPDGTRVQRAVKSGKFEHQGAVSGDGPYQLRQTPGMRFPPPQEPPAERIQTLEDSGGSTALCLESFLSPSVATGPSLPHHAGQCVHRRGHRLSFRSGLFDAGGS